MSKNKKPIITITRDDIKTCCDQTKGLLTNKCVDGIMHKYDVEQELLYACAQALEEILYDYEKSGNRLEYE